VARGYQRIEPAHEGPKAEAIDSTVDDTLETIVREGARRMLAAALEEEVTAFLGRDRYERTGEAREPDQGEPGQPFRGYRNGHLPSRELTVGVNAVAVRVPRVAQVPADVAPAGFHSQLVHRYERASAGTQALFARLYLEGLATGDFEPVFRELVGETTALSPTAIVRLKERWAEDYAHWKRRSLADHQYAYLWADGVVRHEALRYRVGSISPPAVCRSRSLKLEAV
jgi:transposase-like protein